jgi:hypothetical protein
MAQSLIYSLVKYLRTEFPTVKFYVNSIRKLATEDFIPDQTVLLKYSGGTETPWSLFNRPTIQVIVRDIDQVDAEKISFDIYNKLHGHFGLLLPSVTVKTVTYDEIHTAGIQAIQKPFSLGDDDNGRVQFSNNYEFFYSRKD